MTNSSLWSLRARLAAVAWLFRNSTCVPYVSPTGCGAAAWTAAGSGQLLPRRERRKRRRSFLDQGDVADHHFPMRRTVERQGRLEDRRRRRERLGYRLDCRSGRVQAHRFAWVRRFVRMRHDPSDDADHQGQRQGRRGEDSRPVHPNRSRMVGGWRHPPNCRGGRRKGRGRRFRGHGVILQNRVEGIRGTPRGARLARSSVLKNPDEKISLARRAAVRQEIVSSDSMSRDQQLSTVLDLLDTPDLTAGWKLPLFNSRVVVRCSEYLDFIGSDYKTLSRTQHVCSLIQQGDEDVNRA